VTVDGPKVDRPRSDLSVPPSSRSQAALEEYRTRLRPWRIAYAVGIAVVVIVALVAVKIAYNHGEISHVKLRTAAKAAPSVALTGPSATLTPAWTSSDHTAIGTPYWGGTVITYSQHSVDGRDALTGAMRWSYTRSDRNVCTAAQIQGLTVAVFALAGNCDEVTTLDSGTGQRKWTRTLDEDSSTNNHEVQGHPTYAVGQYTFMITTPNVIYAIDPVSSYDRWIFSQSGCRINSAVLGTAGALISQTCTAPKCSGLKFCGRGQQLLLRDPTAGQNDDSSKNEGNPDQIKWNLIGNTSTPVSADSVTTTSTPPAAGTVISAAPAGSSQLDILDATKGKTLSTLTLKAPLDSTPTASAATHAELIHTGGFTYAVSATQPDLLWSAPTIALPTVTTPDGEATPDLPGAFVAVPTTAGVDLLDGATGSVVKSYPVAAPPSGSQVYAFGTGFVVAGSSTAVYR
jgi:outer membrane protein assembly factor BamB